MGWPARFSDAFPQCFATVKNDHWLHPSLSTAIDLFRHATYHVNPVAANLPYGHTHDAEADCRCNHPFGAGWPRRGAGNPEQCVRHSPPCNSLRFSSRIPSTMNLHGLAGQPTAIKKSELKLWRSRSWSETVVDAVLEFRRAPVRFTGTDVSVVSLARPATVRRR
jgi:hypothetical protein